MDCIQGLYFVLGFIKSAYLVNALSTVVSVLFGMAIYFYIMILVRGITKMILTYCRKKSEE